MQHATLLQSECVIDIVLTFIFGGQVAALIFWVTDKLLNGSKDTQITCFKVSPGIEKVRIFLGSVKYEKGFLDRKL